jgi:hypothetical protein
MIPNESGKMPPATPWITRAAISWVASWLSPQAADAPVKRTRPAAKRLRGPNLSPSRPAVMSSTA